jgi:hypothetical protein
MVTHRWWGNKFCKLFARRCACLAAAVAVAVLTLLLACVTISTTRTALERGGAR